MLSLYSKKVILKTQKNVIYKAFVIYSNINIYILQHELSKHDIWKYF